MLAQRDPAVTASDVRAASRISVTVLEHDRRFRVFKTGDGGTVIREVVAYIETNLGPRPFPQTYRDEEVLFVGCDIVIRTRLR